MKNIDQKYNGYIFDILKDSGISLIGFANLSEIDSKQRSGLEYGICFAIALKVFPSISNQPTIEYYEEYRKINQELKEISFLLEDRIKEKGFDAYSLARNGQNQDFRTVLPFKTLATRCGLGWIGKSSTLITHEYGSAVRLNGVITNMPFETALPINASYCGNCRECVEKCPANAISGNNWDLSKDRDDLMDPYKCKNTVIERGQPFDITVGSCGICLSACPWTQKYIKRLNSKGR